MTLGNAPMEDSGLMEDSASTLHASLSAYASLSRASLSRVPSQTPPPPPPRTRKSRATRVEPLVSHAQESRH